MKNFAANFQKESVHDYKGFFKTTTPSEELIEAQKEFRRLQRELEMKQHDIVRLQNKRYHKDFVPAPEKYCLLYSGRNCTDYRFDIDTGEILAEQPCGVCEIGLATKKGSFSYVKGYDFNLAAVLVRKVNYIINATNTSVRFVSGQEILVPMLEAVSEEFFSGNSSVSSDENFIPLTALQRVSANFFIENYFGIKTKIDFSLKKLKGYFNKNKSVEIILKNGDEAVTYELLQQTVEKPLPIHKIVGCSKESWAMAVKCGVQYEFLRFKMGYTDQKLKQFKKSELDWIDFLSYTKGREADLQFYNIDYEGNLAFSLIDKYIGWGYHEFKDFPRYYKFGKFCNYVVDETINQGISSIYNFVLLLSDYLRMCQDIGITPTLYSSYLKQTHDISVRNHKIAITQEMDDMFAHKYSDFDTYITDTYAIIAPHSCSDLQAEGDALNHCVASYITRVINNECKIFFLREANNIKKSLVTVEVRDGAIVQARGVHNRDILPEESMALRQFALTHHLKYNV